MTLALRLVARLPRGDRDLRDQLKRAAMSVPLNIAEGSGKPAPADRARFYAIARGAAMECGALVDVCRVAGFLPAAEAQDAKTLLARIVAMFTKCVAGEGIATQPRTRTRTRTRRQDADGRRKTEDGRRKTEECDQARLVPRERSER
ncbi:four helix bundle protein [Sorangium sp. So ce854]|uniref:four helix bundle protein n=1 Tax=Sorangium sp. So ce854 TaxID=3133322 RepID=UPI003F5DBEDC